MVSKPTFEQLHKIRKNPLADDKGFFQALAPQGLG
jgi:hypothetical protein